MPVPIEFNTAWRKSSFSGGDANCVEIALGSWRKSSLSGVDSNCVEVAVGTWRKSSVSGPDANCVEVAYAADVLAVRDSKNPEGGYLVFPRDAVSAVLSVP
jgi:hypothetical protein